MQRTSHRQSDVTWAVPVGGHARPRVSVRAAPPGTRECDPASPPTRALPNANPVTLRPLRLHGRLSPTGPSGLHPASPLRRPCARESPHRAAAFAAADRLHVLPDQAGARSAVVPLPSPQGRSRSVNIRPQRHRRHRQPCGSAVTGQHQQAPAPVLRRRNSRALRTRGRRVCFPSQALFRTGCSDFALVATISHLLQRFSHLAPPTRDGPRGASLVHGSSRCLA